MNSDIPKPVPVRATDTGASATVSPCWSCRGPVAAEGLFCGTCEAVQPPGQADHFARLSLDVSYEVDGSSLDSSYFGLQRRLHPDRFAARSPRERSLSMQQATSLNEAYETLKDPLKRADYLIHLKGQDVLPEGCNLVNDQMLLMESMELREALAEAENEADIETLEQRAAGDIRDCEFGLSAAFRADDLADACSLTTRLKYMNKLAEEVRQRKIQMMKGA